MITYRITVQVGGVKQKGMLPIMQKIEFQRRSAKSDISALSALYKLLNAHLPSGSDGHSELEITTKYGTSLLVKYEARTIESDKYSGRVLRSYWLHSDGDFVGLIPRVCI